MPRFEPFRALRYAPDIPLDAVSAPPYDVLSDADVAALAGRDPHNIVIVDVPAANGGDDRYEQAGHLLRQWIADGVLRADESPSFTLYRMSFTDTNGRRRETVGVIGALEVVDEGADGVLAHERTTPKATSDRLDLTRATRTNLSPVWGLSLTAGLTELLSAPADAVGRCTDEHGVVHSVERVVDPPRLAAIAAAVGRSAVLIADGHHRYAVARTYRDEVRAGDADAHSHAGGDRHAHTHAGGEPSASAAAETTMAYVAELVDEQLSIDPIHRLYHGIDAADLLAHLATAFEIDDAGQVTAAFAAEAVEIGALCLVRPDGTGVWLRPRPDAFRSVRALDGAYLEHALGGLNVDVTYQHGVDEVIAAVATGHATVGVLIRPTSIDEIRRTAEERLLMPPKSTFFTPKLRTGLVLRPLWAGPTLAG